MKKRKFLNRVEELIKDKTLDGIDPIELSFEYLRDFKNEIQKQIEILDPYGSFAHFTVSFTSVDREMNAVKKPKKQVNVFGREYEEDDDDGFDVRYEIVDWVNPRPKKKIKTKRNKPKSERSKKIELLVKGINTINSSIELKEKKNRKYRFINNA